MEASSIPERGWHRAVVEILEGFDSGVLARLRCHFAGGTRIAMDLGEFRESRDIDFLCPDPERYAELRVTARAFLADDAFQARCFKGLSIASDQVMKLTAAVAALVDESVPST